MVSLANYKFKFTPRTKPEQRYLYNAIPVTLEEYLIPFPKFDPSKVSPEFLKPRKMKKWENF